jgi:hypothetical protein
VADLLSLEFTYFDMAIGYSYCSFCTDAKLLHLIFDAGYYGFFFMIVMKFCSVDFYNNQNVWQCYMKLHIFY